MYRKTKVKKRTPQEVRELLEEKKAGMNVNEMAEKHNRTVVSVSVKLKRLGKEHGNYNKLHIKDKYETNKKFMDMINPEDVLDLYCGTNMWRAENCYTNVYSNDINENIPSEYHEDAERLIAKLWLLGYEYDIVDLDPYGSAYACLDKAIKLAKKGLIVTLGEMGHKRFKRLDYVRYRYNINSLEEFTIDNLITEIQKIGVQNKKELIPVFIKEWNKIGRVYFMIREIKNIEERDRDHYAKASG